MSFTANDLTQFEYSYDKVHWMPWTNTAVFLEFSGEEPLYLRGSNVKMYLGALGTFHFQNNAPVRIEGNIMYLLSHDEELTQIPYPDNPYDKDTDGAFTRLFKDCTALAQAPKLTATRLAPHCYEGMFEGCTSLEEAPPLPATYLDAYCYKNMFKGCTSLMGLEGYEITYQYPATAMYEMIKATKMSTTSYSCCESMFEGCTSLTISPILSPAIDLARDCYKRMFYGCSSLTEVSAGFDYYYFMEGGASVTGFTDDWLVGVPDGGLFNHALWRSAPDGFESEFPRSTSTVPPTWELSAKNFWFK